MNIEKYYDLLLAGTRTVRCQAVQAIENLIDLPPALLIDIEQKGLEYTAASISPKNRIQVSEYFEDKSAELSVFSDSSGFEIKAILGGALEIRNCHDFRLNLMEIKNIEKKNREKFHIRIIGCRNFVVFGGKHIGLRNFILVSESRDFVLRDFDVVGCDGYGVVIFNSLFFRVINASFKKCLASGVYCLGKTMYGKIEKTKFIGGRGYFNWDAGLHINHCTNAIDINDIPEKSHENASIVDKLNKPSYIYVKDCDFINNRAQGIYCEGGNNIYISNCVIKGNNKEGVCFDWGSAMNGFYSNHVLQNGNRAALTAEEIKADFIERYPLLADGSSSCKLAGVSIDNGVFNFIKNNVFLGNYGGGVKMVRTGISNLIMDNCSLKMELDQMNILGIIMLFQCLAWGLVTRNFQIARII